MQFESDSKLAASVKPLGIYEAADQSIVSSPSLLGGMWQTMSTKRDHDLYHA